MAWQSESTDWKKESSLTLLWEPNQVRSDQSQYILNFLDFRQIPIHFQSSLQCSKWRKESNLWYLSLLYIVYISWSTVCIQGIHSALQNVYNRRRLLSFSCPNVSISVDDASSWQWISGHFSNCLPFKLFFRNSFCTRSTVSSLGFSLLYATKTDSANRL